jgi:hypothetical protein
VAYKTYEDRKLKLSMALILVMMFSLILFRGRSYCHLLVLHQGSIPKPWLCLLLHRKRYHLRYHVQYHLQYLTFVRLLSHQIYTKRLTKSLTRT